MSQKDTILDVLRRAQQPLEPKITKSAGETPAARRSAKDRSRRKDQGPTGHEKSVGRQAGMQGLQRFGHWISGDFSMPRAGLYLGLSVAVVLAFGAYKIGVRRGQMGSSRTLQSEGLASLKTPKDLRGAYLENRNEGRDQGKTSGMGPLAHGDYRRISEPGSPVEVSGADSKVARDATLAKGKPLSIEKMPVPANEESITVLRLLSTPDSAEARRTIAATRDWLRTELSKQSLEALRSVQVYTWMSSSSRRGGRKSVCLEVSLPKAWDKGRFLDTLAGFGLQRHKEFRFDFRDCRDTAASVLRLPSEIAAVLEREKLGH